MRALLRAYVLPLMCRSTEEKYLIATAEQPIAAFHRGEWIDTEVSIDLSTYGPPIYNVGTSPSLRWAFRMLPTGSWISWT